MVHHREYTIVDKFAILVKVLQQQTVLMNDLNRRKSINSFLLSKIEFLNKNYLIITVPYVPSISYFLCVLETEPLRRTWEGGYDWSRWDPAGIVCFGPTNWTCVRGEWRGALAHRYCWHETVIHECSPSHPEIRYLYITFYCRRYFLLYFAKTKLSRFGYLTEMRDFFVYIECLKEFSYSRDNLKKSEHMPLVNFSQKLVFTKV